MHGQFSRHLCLHICTASAYDAGAGSGGRETEAGAGRSHPELRGAVAEPSVPVRDKTRPVRGTQGRTKEHRQIRGSCLASAAALQRGHPAAGARHWRTVALTRRSRHRTVEEKKSAPGFTTDVSFPTTARGLGVCCRQGRYTVACADKAFSAPASGPTGSWRASVSMTLPHGDRQK